jgi:hypothetical protein
MANTARRACDVDGRIASQGVGLSYRTDNVDSIKLILHIANIVYIYCDAGGKIASRGVRLS